MGSKKPKQPTTTADMGQFGSTTTGSFGSKWNATDFQNQFVNNAQQQMLNAQNMIANPELTQAKLDDLNRQAQSQFQNELLMPAMQKGLLRGSTAQDIGSVANRNYANSLQSAIESEQQRQQALKAQALADYLSIFDVSKGVTGLSNAANQAASNYLLQSYTPPLWATLASSLGDAGSPSIKVNKS